MSVPKHKQKPFLKRLLSNTKTNKARTKKFKPASQLKQRLVALAVITLVLAPASWLAVNAQSADVGGANIDGQNAGAVSGSSGTDSNGKPVTPGVNDDKPTTKTTEAAKAAEAKKSAAAASAAKAAATSKPVAKPAPVPTPAPAPAPAPAPLPTGWHDNIITTIFWVGEPADASNAHISNAMSAWDGNWESNYGGFDDPDNRNGYNPAGFTPKENPFYFALPYNDLDENGDRKSTAGGCPNSSNTISWCKNAWIKIVFNGKTAYAQWQDVGPMEEDDAAYVFGTAQPKNTQLAKAGLDVSPAVRDYLGLSGIDRTGWSFVPAGSVPGGPWKSIVTTSQGGW